MWDSHSLPFGRAQGKEWLSHLPRAFEAKRIDTASRGARMSNRVKVEIYGQSYNLGGDLDEAYVQKLARYVDEKMRAVSDATQTVDSVRVAVLAAMAIADELHSQEKQTVHRDDALRERAQQCLTILERALKQTA
jgi:cell division protein ZapA